MLCTATISSFSPPRYRLRPRVLRDVSKLDTKISLLGEEVAFPICVSPMGQQCVVHPEGEAATARGMHHVTDEISQSPTHPSIYSPPACANLGTCMTLSTYSTTSMEDVAMANGSGLRWYMLCVLKDRGVTRDLIQRAERAGYKALVVTVDVPTSGVRLVNARNPYILPSHLCLANFTSTRLQSSFDKDRRHVLKMVYSLMDPSSTWDTIDWICSVTKLPVLLKGILTAEDAVEAVKHNIRGIIVSNHGARQLDGVPATVSLFVSAGCLLLMEHLPCRLMFSMRWWRL